MENSDNLKSVVVILLGKEDNCLLTIKEKYNFHFLEDHSYKDISTTLVPNEIDIVKFTKHVQNYCKENSIDGAFIQYDLDSLIFAAVAEDPEIKFKCPSFESVFLSCHKYYGRKSERNPIKFDYIDLDSDEWTCKEFKYPFFLKPCSLADNMFQYLIKNYEDLVEKIQLCKVVRHFEKEYVDLFREYLPKDKYPLIYKNIMMVEEFVENSFEFNWQGFVNNEGEVTTYCFVDTNFLESYPSITADYTMPSSLNEEVLKRAENVCCEFIKDTNFKNGFINFDLWHRPNGAVQIIESNSRMVFIFFEQYHLSYGCSVYEHTIELSLNNKLQNLPSKETFRKVSSYCLIKTRKSGKIKDLFNFEYFETIKSQFDQYYYYFDNEETVFSSIEALATGKITVGIIMSDTDYENIKAKCKIFRKNILKLDEY